jgi:hypothetical protein
MLLHLPAYMIIPDFPNLQFSINYLQRTCAILDDGLGRNSHLIVSTDSTFNFKKIKFNFIFYVTLYLGKDAPNNSYRNANLCYGVPF